AFERKGGIVQTFNAVPIRGDAPGSSEQAQAMPPPPQLVRQRAADEALGARDPDGGFSAQERDPPAPCPPRSAGCSADTCRGSAPAPRSRLPRPASAAPTCRCP